GRRAGALLDRRRPSDPDSRGTGGPARARARARARRRLEGKLTQLRGTDFPGPAPRPPDPAAPQQATGSLSIHSKHSRGRILRVVTPAAIAADVRRLPHVISRA